MIFPIEENNIKHKRGCPKGQSLSVYKKYASYTEDRVAGVHEGVKTRLVIQ